MISEFFNLIEGIMISSEYEGLSMNDIAELVRIDGKLVIESDFSNIHSSLYLVGGDIVEVWINNHNGNAEKVEHIINQKIDPFLKYLDVSKRN